MTAGPRLLQAISDAFDALRFRPVTLRHAAVGPFCAGLRLSGAVPAEYLRAFVPARDGVADFEFAVATASDMDLTDLIPQPGRQGRAYLGSSYSAVWHVDQDRVLYLFDFHARRGLVWLADDRAPAWELSRPACPLIQCALLDGPWTTLHGAAVGRNGRVLLLAGKGNAGKSTAALACAAAGWDYAGDDYILANTQTAEIAPLYRSARLRPDIAPAFADLLASVPHSCSETGGDLRHELDLSQTAGTFGVAGGALAAILIPRRRGAAHPSFTPARRADAFNALFLTTNQGAPTPLKRSSERLSLLVGRAPVSFVDTGSEPGAIPAAFENFLAQL